MGGLFGNLEIGRKSLLAQQLALEVTSNNIANVNTPGYSRQRAVMQTSIPVQSIAGQIGSGVDVKSIESARDRFVEYRLSRGIQANSKQEAILDSLNQVQASFNVDAQGLQEGISRFFNSFSTLASNPESTPLRNSVVSAAQNLSSVFQASAQQLVDVQQSVNSKIVDVVNQVNSLVTSLGTLNVDVANTEATGTQASTLRDQRGELIKQLSDLVDIHYYETEDGTVTISLAGGRNLVTAGFVETLDTVPTAPNGLVQVTWGGQDVTGTIQGGKLAGLLQVRDEQIPAYQTDLDTLAEGIIREVNTLHQGGTDLQNPPTSPTLNFFNPVSGVAGAAAALSVNASVISDVRYIAAGQSGTPGDNANALAIAHLINQKLLTGGTETFSEAYGSLQFRIGTDAQSAQRSVDAQNALLNQLQNLRDSVSGVSLDEEAVDLVRYQRAYQASARFISVIDQLTEELIATLGQ